MSLIQDVLTNLTRGERLDYDTAERVFTLLLEGELEEAQTAALLALLQTGPITPDELTGAARVMRSHVTPVPYAPGGDEALLDTCGTGGTRKTFNVSTVAAIIAASVAAPAGRPRPVVAKHGNRSRTGRGSAEVLEALGVNVNAGTDVQAKCLSEAGVCFCFAIHHHPAMRHAMGPRRALGFPTIFNVLGPLTNPAGAHHQVIGVYQPTLVPLVAETLRRLGSSRATVMHAREGLDEAGLAKPTDATVLADGSLDDTVIDPGGLGLAPVDANALVASDIADAARIARTVLSGEPGAHTDLALLNAAIALHTCRTAETLEEGIDLARQTVASGRATATLETLARVSGEPA